MSKIFVKNVLQMVTFNASIIRKTVRVKTAQISCKNNGFTYNAYIKSLCLCFTIKAQ